MSIIKKGFYLMEEITEKIKTFILKNYIWCIALWSLLMTLKATLIVAGTFPMPPGFFVLRFFIYLIFFSSVIFLLFSLSKRGYALGFYLLSSVFYFSILGYYTYYGRLISILETLPHLKAGLETVRGGVLDFIPMMLLLLIDLIPVILLIVFYNNPEVEKQRIRLFGTKFSLISAMGIFLLSVFLPGLILSLPGFDNESENRSNPQLWVSAGGVWFYSIHSIRRRNYFKEKGNSDGEGEILVVEDTPDEILPEKPNFLFIQIESLQTGAVEFQHNGQYLMPYLNRLSKTAVYYPYCFAYHGVNGTTDSEISIFNNIDPSKEDSFENNENTYPRSFIKDIKEGGWTPVAFHNFRADFFNRAAAYPKLGFEKFYDFYSMNFPEPIGWWPEDRLLFEFILDKFEPVPEPFLYYVITVSTHKKFWHIDRFYSNPVFDDISDKDDRCGQLCFNYSDKQVEKFVNEFLKRYPNTYVFIYGDHSVNGIPFEGKMPQALVPYKGRSVEVVPLFIITPDGKQSRNYDTLATFHDIAPTVFSLIPEDAELDTPVFGGSLIGDDRHRILHRKPVPLQGDFFSRDELLAAVKEFMREKNTFFTER